MIVRNIESEAVRSRWYVAHGGGTATMLFESSELKGILFLAHAELKPGKELELHTDPYEEIYYVLRGKGLMTVEGNGQQVAAGDAIWIPFSVPHSLVNNGTEECVLLVVAGMPRDYLQF